MRYIINCRLKGPVERYQKRLVNEIADKFNLTLTKEENLDTHFTLKYSFETNNIEEIEKLCKNFCEKNKKSKVKVGTFSGFKPHVIFINVNLSKEAKDIFSKFIKELKKIKWMEWDQYDAENLHFHSTIAENCNDKYQKVMNFLENKEQIFECFFDNITILKLVSGNSSFGKWKKHKTFLFQS
ncbi:2'-5' RNA ligase family protein [Candidatus Woesearchaeota archaeon]|nr:2'-5' RNA ligase family protein [Candidatus Woesearchaeota archaeon]